MSQNNREVPHLELITGSCIGFFDSECKECKSCREAKTCETIVNSEDLSKEFGELKKDRKNINHILRTVKGGQLF